MIATPSKEDIQKLQILHDKIKNHEFRKNPQQYLLDEYANLFEDVNKVIGRYSFEKINPTTYEREYLYYRTVKDRILHYKDSHFADGWFHCNDVAEIFSNPTIAIMDYAMHDFRGIKWKLNHYWNTTSFKDAFARFTETTEILLSMLHRLIEGELVTKVSFPVETLYSKNYSTYEMVKNPLYDNDWTLTKYLEKERWFE